MKYQLFWGALLFVVFLMGCEKDINLSVNEVSPKLVVDAQIENGVAPTVVLTKSLGYFNTISPQQLLNMFERNATVRITVNNGTTVPLQETAIPLAPGVNAYVYTTNALVGNFNTTYKLDIQLATGEKYTATTTIPALTKTMDSLWWQPAPQNPDPSRVAMFGRFTDPPGLGNYIRYFTKVNREPFFPGFTSVFDDQVVDGTTYSIQFPKGFDKNSLRDTIDFDAVGFFNKGDTATIKFCNIDKATFDFWRTWEYNYSILGSPFATPIRVLNNVNNGALGNFSGYAAQYRTIIIPR